MKIISPFKDYYDRIAGKYGGGDPRLVYKRTKIQGQDTKDRGIYDIVSGRSYELSSLNAKINFQYKNV